ncbi:MAG: gliding motility-associated ABC transporter ATP-binding subunit GldA [Cytophagales bacterium]|nr:MAG: gliding motility-associated ABC transporter ATP-binding subunit GldA [Cytophagales bacterium]
MSISVENLTKIYGNQKAVNDISFQVEAGKIIGFLGPNGAGKSTTMKIATGYIPPTSGTIKVCGFDVNTHSIEVRKQIGYLPEHNPLYLEMYIKEYLGFIGHLHQIKGKKLQDRIKELIEICGLTKEQNKKIVSLSKGYRQRVGLAQALLHNPPVLILDEPTTGLDPNQILEIRQLIKEVGKQKTVIFSTHIMQEVQALCDRVLIINGGKIVADGTVDMLKDQSQSQNIILIEVDKALNTEDFLVLEGINDIKQIENNKYEIKVNKNIDVRAAIFHKINEKKLVLLGMQEIENSLENVFRNLTKN